MVVENIGKILSEILSDKYEVKVQIKFEPLQVGESKNEQSNGN